MSRSHLQASMGFCTPYIYECNQAGRIIRGTAPEIAQAVGRSISWVRDLARNNRRSAEGWSVRQVTRLPRVRYNACVYTAERRNDDPVIGGAEEVGALLGYSPWYIRKLAKTGLMSKAGWRVRKATAEEVESVREV